VRKPTRACRSRRMKQLTRGSVLLTMNKDKPPLPSRKESGDTEKPADEDSEEPEDEVDEAGEESFPASDPPPWTASVAH
jgi:hypothetical protein